MNLILLGPAGRRQRHAGQDAGGQARPPADLDRRHAAGRGEERLRHRPAGQGGDGPRGAGPRRHHHLHAGRRRWTGWRRRRRQCRVHPRRLPPHRDPGGGARRHAGAQEHAAAPRHRAAGGRRGAGGADLRALHLREVRPGLPRPVQAAEGRRHLRRLRLATSSCAGRTTTPRRSGRGSRPTTARPRRSCPTTPPTASSGWWTGWRRWARSRRRSRRSSPAARDASAAPPRPRVERGLRSLDRECGAP